MNAEGVKAELRKHHFVTHFFMCVLLEHCAKTLCILSIVLASAPRASLYFLWDVTACVLTEQQMKHTNENNNRNKSILQSASSDFSSLPMLADHLQACRT